MAFIPRPPAAYYEKSFAPLHDHSEPVDRKKNHAILIDCEGVVDAGETNIQQKVF